MSATNLFTSEKQKQIFDQSMPEPLEKLIGVIQRYPAIPAGAAGAFCFLAWRNDNNGTRVFPLHLQLAPGVEIPDNFLPFSIHQVTARYSEANRIGLCMKILGPVPNDKRLGELAVRLEFPLTFRDEELGLFKQSEVLDYFKGEVVWNGKKVELTLEPDDELQLKETARCAKILLAAQQNWHKRVIEYAAQELLHIKNDAWTEEGESDLTLEEFKSRITLKSIGISGWGSFDFWFDDGDIFWGHDINVTGDLETGPDHAEFCG